MRLALLATATLAILACGCPNGSHKRPYPAPTVDELLGRIAATRDGVGSFQAETVMDYWMNDQRVKGGVLVMGTTGSQVRINALSPAGNDVIADLACDGTNYAFIDKNKNCQLTGPCSKETIASLFNIALAPDDFVQLATGATPVVPGAKGTVKWDEKAAKEVLQLTGDDGRTQTIVLDARDGHADIISSEVKLADGTQEWRIDNTEYTTLKDVNDLARRVPGKSRFRSPGEKADLLVIWKDRVLDSDLDAAKFQLEIPGGLPSCSQSKPTP
jgi:hypothetical protein